MLEKPLRLIELFAGYGSQALALDYLNIPYESWFVCDFDKYAIQSYNDIHSTEYDPIDIKTICADDLKIEDVDKYDYLLTYSFPCTDLSVAGAQQGMSEGSGTRSSLLWEVKRILTECKNLPQYLVMENVPQVIGKNNKNDFMIWVNFLVSLGYTNSYELLNAKDFGIPQNRCRCFMVSVLNGKKFKFPKSIPLTLRLKDMLENNVDEKYYLSDKGIRYVEKREGKYTQLVDGQAELVKSAITAGKWDKMYESARRVYDGEGLSPTLHTCGGGNTETKILVRNNTQKGYLEAQEGDGVYTNVSTKRGTVTPQMIHKQPCKIAVL